MDLELAGRPLISIKVSVPAGGDDGGRMQKGDFEVEFIRHSERQFRAIQAEVAASDARDDALVRKLFRSFRGVELEDGSSLKPDPEGIDILLDQPGMPTLLVITYLQSRDAAAQKK